MQQQLHPTFICDLSENNEFVWRNLKMIREFLPTNEKKVPTSPPGTRGTTENVPDSKIKEV